MRVLAIIEEALSLGITLSVTGDKITYAPKSRTPEEFVERLKKHKLELLEHLSRQFRVVPTTRTQNPQNPQNIARPASEIEATQHDRAHLLAWASELAEQEVELDRSVSFVEAPLRTVTTEEVSRYAYNCLRTILVSHTKQSSSRCNFWNPMWWRKREEEAFGALAALRQAMEEQSDGDNKP